MQEYCYLPYTTCLQSVLYKQCTDCLWIFFSSHGHPPSLFSVKCYSFSSKKWTKEKKAGALSLLYSQLSGRHTLLFFFFSAHKRDLLKVFGKKKYEAYVQSVFSVINKVTEAEKPIMSCHRIWIPICFLLYVFRQKIIMESRSWEARPGYDSWVGFVLNLPGSIWPTACWVSGAGTSL